MKKAALLSSVFNGAVAGLLLSLAAHAQTQPQGAGQIYGGNIPAIQRNAFPSHAAAVTPANPTGTASTSGNGVMMGLGAAASPCVFTPVYSANVRVEIFGTVANSTSGDGGKVTGYFGTGAAPANGAALTGTTWSPNVSGISSAAGSAEEFYVSGHLSGLTLGTAYWYDTALAAITGGTASLTNVQCAFNEE